MEDHCLYDEYSLIKKKYKKNGKMEKASRFALVILFIHILFKLPLLVTIDGLSLNICRSL